MVSITVDSTNYSAAPRWDSNGKGYYYCYATSGCPVDTPTVITCGWNAVTGGCGWRADAMASLSGSYYAVRKIVGVPEAVIASGCMGWIQFVGRVAGVQCGAANLVGSIGHAISWGTANVVIASTSAYQGAYHQFAVIAASGTGTMNASTTCAIFLTGNFVCTQ